MTKTFPDKTFLRKNQRNLEHLRRARRFSYLLLSTFSLLLKILTSVCET